MLRQKLDKYERLPLAELKELYLKRLGSGKITKRKCWIGDSHHI